MQFLNAFGHAVLGVVGAAVFTIHIILGGFNSYSTFVAPAPLPAPLETTSSLPHAEVVTTSSPPVVTPKPKLEPITTAITTSSTPTSSTTTISAPVPLMGVEQVNGEVRQSLVNILCTTQAGGYFEPISGSGVIIDARGIVLTNAHVGQFFLLKDYPRPGNIDCVLRTGSPAEPTYRAELMYLPPEWIDANASQILSSRPIGNGEFDFAFLRITSTVGSGLSLPILFPALPMTSQVDSGEPVLLAAYPAGFLDGETIQENLYLSSAPTVIQQLYGYHDLTNVDAIGVGGTIVSQSGSSGGAVVKLQDGKLAGIISTASQGTTTASRELDAITIGYIDRALMSEGMGGLLGLLSEDPTAVEADFASSTESSEAQALETYLNKVSR